MKILVVSCDKNKDLFDLFHHCLEKYGPKHPEVYYLTESIENPFYKTIKKDFPISAGTARIREAIKEINDNSILMMLDDIFIRKPVDNEYILSLEHFLTNDVAHINFEGKFFEGDFYYTDKIGKRNYINNFFKTSVMCGLGDKEKMLHIFAVDCDPGHFEKLTPPNYTFLITEDNIINFGKVGYYGGIVEGKLSKELISFLKSEGFKANTIEREVADE